MYLINNPDNLTVLEQVLEQSEAIFFIYESNRFRYISPAFREVWEQDRNIYYESPGKLLHTIHPEDLEDLQHSWELPPLRRKKVQEFRIICPEGKVKWLRLKPFYVFTEQNERGISGFVEDISAAKEHDFTLLKYTAKKNSSLEILSHDLIGPLNIIDRLADFILEASQPYNNGDITQDLELIRETCSRSVTLIRDLVNQEFLESVNTELKKERHDLVEKLQIVVDNYRQSERAVAKKFNLAFISQPVFVEIDEVKFMQVINNLISNAIKFTPDNGTINIIISDEVNQVIIAIEDNGIGIPEKYHPVLFDRFTPARRPGLRGEPSVGLGMSIIKRIVEMHQGQIWFESKIDQGTYNHPQATARYDGKSRLMIAALQPAFQH
jgi:two-component system, OmpR family, sensor histidine kinase VicK